jgi:TonB-linked SusC/RagA family outer membrane protein
MKNNLFDEVSPHKRRLKKLILIMKLTTLFSVILSLNLGASVYSQNTKFNLDLSGKTVREVFQILEQQSQFRFFYNDDFNYIDNVVSMNVENENVEQILAKLFETSDITYKVFNDNLVVLTPKANLQQVAIKGTITDGSSLEPMPGANVQIKGTTRGAVADVNGKYSIDAKAGDILVFSFIGYIPEEIAITNQTSLDVALSPDIQSLDEVVVVGYGTQKRTEVTGAVTSVTSEKLTALPSGTLDAALQGRAAGLTVISNGAPGTAPTMRVRGIGTVNNNDPLYVVDGVVTAGITNLNPDDIESIQVLKDASTVAIYGSQGSNGVIMVTTKKGASGKVTVSFDAFAGTQYTTERYDVLNTEQYIAYAALMAEPDPPAIYDPNRMSAETNWQDEIYQSGLMQNYNLSLSGGTENSTYRISAGYLDQEGIIIETGNKRYNFRANSDFKVGRLKIGENISLSFGKQNPLADNGGRSLLEHAIKMAPYLPVYNPNNLGGFQGPNTAYDGQDAENPVRIMKLNSRENLTTNILGNIYGELELLKGLKFKTNVGLEDIRIDQNNFFPAYDDDNLGSTHVNGSAQIFKNRATYQSIIFTNSLNYTITLADKHNFDLLGLAEASNINKTTLNANSRNEVSDVVNEVGNISHSLASTTTEYKRIGYLARLNYNFDQKYLFAASIRKDASSRFGKNNRWGTFPSLALGWNIHKESFMQGIPAISNLKLRGSWGKAGNDKIGDYSYSTTLTTNMYYVINGVAVMGVTPSGFSNPNLKWEETTMTNIGLDLGLLNNQFTMSAEYFMNKSNDLLMNVPLPESMGVPSGVKSENAGSMETKGFELQLGYNDFEGELQWSANLNLGTFKNEVVSLGDAANINGAVFEADPLTRCTVGQPAFYFYGWEFDGIFQTDAEVTSHAGGTQTTARAGDFRIKDVAGIDTDGNRTGPDGRIDGNDRTNIGNPFPKLTLGIDLNASYKGIDLNVFISGIYGNDVYNTNIYDLQGMPRLFNAGVEVLDRWTPTNPSNTIPRLGGIASNTQSSTRFIEDGAFTRLKNVSLGYTIPSSLLKNKLTKLRIYVSAQNMITLTKYTGLDPEVGSYTTAGNALGNIGGGNTNINFTNGIDLGNYPVAKSVIGGIQITF